MKGHRPDLAGVASRVPLALPTALLAMAVLVLALLSTAGLWPGERANRATPTGPLASLTSIGTPSASPAQVSNAELTSSPNASPSPSPSPSASQSPSPSPGPVIREASAVARIPKCQDALGWDYEISGGDLFVVCADPDEGTENGPPYTGPYVARVQLSTNKVTATYRYKTPLTYIEGIAIAGGGLWFDGIFGGSACVSSKPGGCDGWERVVRLDLVTGKVTLEIPNVSLRAFALGGIWVRDNGLGRTFDQHRLRKLDPRSGRQQTTIPFDMDVPIFACGSLWGVTWLDSATPSEATRMARIDPANGHVLSTFTEPGQVWGPQSVGDECWATTSPATDDMDLEGYSDHFVRLGRTGIDERSPRFDVGILRNVDPEPGSQSEVRETRLEIDGGAFWLMRDDLGPIAWLQRIDPATWQPSGTMWRWTGPIPQGGPFAIIDGSAWALDSDGGMVRLDIPI